MLHCLINTHNSLLTSNATTN